MYEGDELRQKYEDARNSIKVPDGCKYPDCFHCVFTDCVAKNISGEKYLDEELIRGLSKIGWR